MAAGPRVSVDIAEKRYPGQGEAVFSGLQFVVEPGTILALVGPSGVGKSTLLRLIGGIDTDYAGSIRIDGTPADKTPPAGYVFQDARLLPWCTVAGNLSAVRPSLTVAEIDAALDRVGLAGQAKAYPHELSGGMQRRVALARALAVNSRLLLLDEPLVSLDRDLVAQMQGLLLDLLAETKATAILVTHIAEDAARLADRAIVLGGRPAHIAADHRFDVVPRQRDPAEIARIVEILGQEG